MSARNKPGFALATVLILLSVALFSAGAVITVSGLESKISVSEREGIDAYYVAEAGIDDALWKIQYNDAVCGSGGCATMLQAGNLNYSYSAANTPTAGKGYSVIMQSVAGQPVGTVSLTSVGSVLTAGFTATRKIVSTGYLGPQTSTINSSAILSGNSVSIRNPNSTISINNGNFYAYGGISLNSATLNMGANCIQSQGSYSQGTSTVTSSGSPCIQASNYPTPPPNPAILVPGFSFPYYQTIANNSYTSADFISAIQVGGTPVTFRGPVTYISDSLLLNTNAARGITINIIGMLVINGSLTTTGNLNGTNINIIDPGNGKSGIFVSQSVTLNSGAFNVAGVLYTASTMKIIDSQPISVNGALVAAGSLDINASANMDLTYNNTRATSSFGLGPPSVLQLRHWEEQY